MTLPPRPLGRHRTLGLIAGSLVCLAVAVPLGAFTGVDATPYAAVTVAPAANGPLLVVGDSLTYGTWKLGGFDPASRRLRSGWSSIVIDAKVGRTAAQGVATLDARLSRASFAGVVVALGTNDMNSNRTSDYARDVIDRVMTAARGVPVLWVNLEYAPGPRVDLPGRATRFNRELRSATRRWTNLRIADWNRSFVPVGRSRFIADGIHLTTSGYKTRAAFMVSEIGAFTSWIASNSTTTSTTSTTPSTTTIVSTTSSAPGTSTTTTSTTSSTTSSTTTSSTPTTAAPTTTAPSTTSSTL